MKQMIYWILVIVPVTIMGQAAYFKWNGEPEIIENFKKLGMEPEGRGLIAIIELICVVLLLFPRLSIYGAILCLGIMVGAIIAHTTVIGFAEDRWQWFLWGLLSGVCCCGVIYMRRDQVPLIRSMFEIT
tara:strand:- start:1003 stop:1389 length:387 start_codon:yes stop_codon:yes gene_type:complete